MWAQRGTINWHPGAQYATERKRLAVPTATDVIMPGMNGRELAKRAESLRPGLKVLYVTGYSRNAIVHQGRLDPGVESMQKPITQEGLATRVRDLLDARGRRGR